MRKAFNHVVDTIIKALGSPSALLIAALVIVGWAVTGPLFNFSDTWQLVINTSTTIVTFLMVFVIQNSQNRDSKAVHIKLDELIRAAEGARNRMALAELETEEEQDRDIKELVAAASKTGARPDDAQVAAVQAKADASKAEARAEHAKAHASDAERSAEAAAEVTRSAESKT